MIIYIIIALIVIGVIYAIFEKLSDVFGGGGNAAFVIFIYVVSFFALSWIGVLGVTAVLFILSYLGRAGMHISEKVKKHNEERNDTLLIDELNRNCIWLGYMSEKMWEKKLPNYVNRKYSTNFADITKNFAEQTEQKKILQSNDWFRPFLNYISEHPQGVTVVKMLNEVECPHFRYTHSTPNNTILQEWMERGTKKANIDVPPIFECHNIKGLDGNEMLFSLTAYGRKRYCNGIISDEGNSFTNEISFDDL